MLVLIFFIQLQKLALKNHSSIFSFKLFGNYFNSNILLFVTNAVFFSKEVSGVRGRFALLR